MYVFYIYRYVYMYMNIVDVNPWLTEWCWISLIQPVDRWSPKRDVDEHCPAVKGCRSFSMALKARDSLPTTGFHWAFPQEGHLEQADLRVYEKKNIYIYMNMYVYIIEF